MARVGVSGRLAALLVAVVLVAGGCEGSGRQPPDTSALGKVRIFLRERANLLAEGDVEGYLATVGPNAMELERGLAEGAADVPLSFANATVIPEGPRTETHFGNAIVEFVYRYEGLPKENLFRFELSYDIDLVDGKWKVTTSVPTGDFDLPVWATGDVEAERSEHFLALYRPGLPRVPEALAAAEEARASLSSRLDLIESDPVHLVVLAGSEEEYAEIKGGEISEEEVAVAQFLFLPLSRPESRSMIVKSFRLLDESATTTTDDGERAPPKEVFQHELAHLALSRFEGPFTPGWVNEGAAMFLADERRVGNWELGLDEGLFDGVSIEFMANERDLADGVEYAYANGAVLYLIETFGSEKFFDFYADFLPIDVTADFDEDPTAVVLRDNYDLTVSELDSRTRAFMQEAVASG